MHGAAWVTVKVWPAMVIVPLRWAPVLPATATLTVPLPVPVAPALTVSQAALLVALQAQVLPAVTLYARRFTRRRRGARGRRDRIGAGRGLRHREGLAGDDAIVPLRWAPVLAATATLTLPLPVPVAPALTVSQAALLVALQAQVLPAVTATLVASPAAGEVRVVGAIA